MVDHPEVVIAMPSERLTSVALPAPTPTHGLARVKPRDPQAVDLEFAVRAAAMLLSEGWADPSTIQHPVMLELAMELAATISAYGMIPEVSARIATRRAGPRAAEWLANPTRSA